MRNEQKLKCTISHQEEGDKFKTKLSFTIIISASLVIILNSSKGEEIYIFPEFKLSKYRNGSNFVCFDSKLKKKILHIFTYKILEHCQFGFVLFIVSSELFKD